MSKRLRRVLMVEKLEARDVPSTAVQGAVLAELPPPEFRVARALGIHYVAGNPALAERSPDFARTVVGRDRFDIAFEVQGDVALRRYSGDGQRLGKFDIAIGPMPQRFPSVTIEPAGHTWVTWLELVGTEYIYRSRKVSR